MIRGDIQIATLVHETIAIRPARTMPASSADVAAAITGRERENERFGDFSHSSKVS
jgi:hypothetical protein